MRPVPGPGFVIGVDFGGTKVAVASATLRGEIVKQVRFDTDAARGAEQAVCRAGEACRAMMAEMEAEGGGTCFAAGVVCPGIVQRDRIALAPNVPGWEDLALQDVMQEQLGVAAVAVGNDVNAAGLAELRWGALAGADPAVFLSLGTGVAAAVLAGGRVLAGAHGAAGELGYSLCGPAEGRAFADGRAPLEESAGGRFIGARASGLLHRSVSAEDAFAAPPSLVCARFLHDAALRGAIALALDLPAARSEAVPELATSPRRG